MDMIITTAQGARSVIQLVQEITWSGDYMQVARTLEFSLLSSTTDDTIPQVDCPLGAGVRLVVEGQTLFDGFVVTRSRDTGGNAMQITCYDRGFYLKRNKACYKFTQQTPKAIASKVAADFGIPLGELADANIPITRIFASGSDSLYDIIATAYTLAARQTGKQYHIGFLQEKLCVTPKEPGQKSLVIQGGSNLMTASTTESIDNCVSAVQIYDQNDKPVKTLEDAQRIQLYGRLQEIIKQAQGEDRTQDAQRLLEEGGPSQKIAVECLGNPASITGGAVIVREPYTGLDGLFFIDSDRHQWRGGQYFNRLVLNFQAIVDQKEAGSAPAEKG